MTIHSSGKNWKPFVRQVAEEVDAAFPRPDWTSTYPGHGEHSAVGAYAIDFMCSKSVGDKIRDYLVKNRKRLAIRYIIWYRVWINWGTDGENAKWKPYFDRNAVNADGTPNPSRRHTNHVHLSCEPDGRYIPPLPTYYVDPAKVSTTLTGNALNGGRDKELKPGDAITDGARIDGKWLITASGYSYHVDYLTQTKPEPVATPSKPTLPTVPKPAPAAETPGPPKPEEPKLTTIRVASYNILSDAAGKAGPEGPLSKRLPLIISTLKASKASVLLLQECNKAAAALVQDKLGPDWVWSRSGTRTVMVDKTVWAMEEEQVVNLPTPFSKADKDFPLVKLRHLKGGDVTWFASVHLSSTSAYKAVASSDQMADERKQQAEAIVKAFAPRDRAVGGGDLNSSSASAGKPKPVLQAGGLTLLTKDKAFDSAKVDSFPNKTPGGQQIDEIWGKGITFLDGDIIQSKGSDHNLMVAEIALSK